MTKRAKPHHGQAWKSLTKLGHGRLYKGSPEASDELLMVVQWALRDGTAEDAMVVLRQIERELDPHCDEEYRLARNRSRRGNPQHVAQDARREKQIERGLIAKYVNGLPTESQGVGPMSDYHTAVSRGPYQAPLNAKNAFCKNWACSSRRRGRFASPEKMLPLPAGS